MKRRLASVSGLLLTTRAALAGVPTLAPVDTGTSPLTFSAPVGWAVQIEPPREMTLSMIATTSVDCPDSRNLFVEIMIDRQASSPIALLEDQATQDRHLVHPRPIKLHGWECLVMFDTRALCTGRLKGLPGVVAVGFSSTDEDDFGRLGAVKLAAAVAASVRWSGSLSALEDWSRDASPAAQAACKK